MWEGREEGIMGLKEICNWIFPCRLAGWQSCFVALTKPLPSCYGHAGAAGKHGSSKKRATRRGPSRWEEVHPWAKQFVPPHPQLDQSVDQSFFFVFLNPFLIFLIDFIIPLSFLSRAWFSMVICRAAGSCCMRAVHRSPAGEVLNGGD